MPTRRSISLFQLNQRPPLDNGNALGSPNKRPLGRRCYEFNLSPAGAVRPGIALTAADAAANAPLEKDLKLIGLLGGLPCEFDDPMALGGAAHVSRPDDLAAYGRYVAQIASHFRGDITLWQSWHDPNRTISWAGRPDPELYAGMLEVQYDAIKQIDPDAQLAFGPIAGCDLPFASAVLTALKGRRAFDVVAVRPHRWSGPATDEQRDVLDEDGVTTVAMNWKQELIALQSMFRRFDYDCDFVIPEFDWVEEETVELRAESMLKVGAETHAELIERQANHIEETCVMLRDDPELDFVTTALWFDMEATQIEDATVDPTELTVTKQLEKNSDFSLAGKVGSS